MEEKFINYLKSIGITETLHEKIEEIYKFYKDICPDEITDIFVTEYVKEDGSREYQNLWFFSPKYCMEAKLFVTQDDFDIAPIGNRIERWGIKKQDYDFKKVTEKSRFYLNFITDSNTRAAFQASKKNCDYLKNIFLQYVLPNLKE